MPTQVWMPDLARRLIIAALLVDVVACSEPTSDDDICPSLSNAVDLRDYQNFYCFVTRVAFDPRSPTFIIGRPYTMRVEVELSGGCSRIAGAGPALIRWSTSDSTVAVLRNQGAQRIDVVGVRAGQVTIGASGERDPGRCPGMGSNFNQVTGPVRPMTVERVTVSTPSPTLVIGEIVPLRATVVDDQGVDVTSEVSVSWTSSNNAIATVTNQGSVTAVAKGPVRISATTAGVTGSIDLVVGDPPPVPVASVTIDGPDVVQAGKTIDLTVTARAADGTLLADRPVLWSSDAPSKADVAPKPNVVRVGVVAGGKVGKAHITAQVERKETTVEVTVIPGDVVKVLVTPPIAAIRIGNSLELSAEARDIKDNVVLNRTFSWTSLQPTVATVSSTGVVTGVALGGAEIRATTAQVEGSATITVSPRRIAYGVANQPSASGTYAAAFGFNSSGGAITITRQAVGSYRVSFAGQRPQTGETETILVSGYGEGNHYCKLAGDWTNGPTTDVVADVRCFTHGGSATDVAFSITLIGDGVLFGQFGFALADRAPSPTPYTPAKSYNSGPSNPPPVSVERSNTGRYLVRFPGHSFGEVDAHAIHVSAVGTGTGRCNVATFAQDAVQVQCFDSPNAVPMDTPFTVTLMDRGRGGGLRAGYVWAVDASANNNEFEDEGVHLMPPSRAYNSSLGQVEVTKLADYYSYDYGRYEVVFRGLTPPGSSPALGVHVVDRDSDEAKYCNVVGWTITAPDLRVTVQCWNQAGGMEDEGFYLIVIQ